MRANPPSGDWRSLRAGVLELIASLAVPVPGFPITRSQLALAASANGDLEVTALILTGPLMEEIEPPLERPEYEELRDALVAGVLAPRQLTRTEYLLKRHSLTASL